MTVRTAGNNPLILNLLKDERIVAPAADTDCRFILQQVQDERIGDRQVPGERIVEQPATGERIICPAGNQILTTPARPPSRRPEP